MSDIKFQVGGKYNWRNQPERLSYMGIKRYPGDSREWHQFEKVDAPGKVWSEVLDSELSMFEETASPTPATSGTGLTQMRIRTAAEWFRSHAKFFIDPERSVMLGHAENLSALAATPTPAPCPMGIKSCEEKIASQPAGVSEPVLLDEMRAFINLIKGVALYGPAGFTNVRCEQLFNECARLNGLYLAARESVSEPVEQLAEAWQMRKSLPGQGWQAWAECSKKDHDAIQANSQHWGLKYESRPLYTHPVKPGGDVVREALKTLMLHFPTDADMVEAGWNEHQVNAACEAHDSALKVLGEQGGGG